MLQYQVHNIKWLRMNYYAYVKVNPGPPQVTHRILVGGRLTIQRILITVEFFLPQFWH